MEPKPGDQLREILFGESIDLSTTHGPGAEAHLFAEARDDLARGNPQAACRALETIGLRRELEPLYRIHAWNLLRKAGGSPTASVRGDVLAVIVEVGVEEGDDLLAAYDDRTARYYNYSGAGVVWLRPDPSLDSLIDAVLGSARAIVPRIGPWQGPRRPPPTVAHVRLNILTPVGLHFGEGPFDALDRDPTARPLVRAATQLMAKLTSLPRGRSEPGQSN